MAMPLNPSRRSVVRSVPATMLPSKAKAERILSRYRPIAPKPLPLPPSGSFGTTDPSSTCASIDSFTSSAICKKSRKRKVEDASSAKGLKAPKSIGSGVSYNGAASSLTQGVSDGTVPLRDLRSASELSCGSRPHGIEDGVEMSNAAARNVRGMAPDLRFVACGGVVPHQYFTDMGNMVQSQGLYMSPGGTQQQQLQFTLLNQSVSMADCNPERMIAVNRDTGFMERAAAASSSVMPERHSSVPICDIGCAKGVAYVGGGFTEMIRGITRLPTAADVQSLMQARASATIPCGQGVGTGTGSPSALRLSPTSSKDMSQRKVEVSPLPSSSSQSWMLRSPIDVEQMCDNDVDLVTLPLFPNAPSRMCQSSAVPCTIGSPSTQAPSPSRNMDHDQTSPCATQPFASCSRRTAAVTNCSLLSISAKKVGGGSVVPSISSSFMQANTSPVMADGAAVDENYLEQVYGCSTDPVLLLDDNKQVLWYNKSYDKALRSASERSTGKVTATGPYIDPLGHPTPLGTFVFPYYGKLLQATLWGFLRKLVIQENEVTVEHGAPGQCSQLHLSMGGAAQRVSPVGSEPLSRIKSAVCPRNAWLTTMTLESVTNVHMEVPSIAESVEGAEARLGAGNLPAFLTDCGYRVRWVNAALRQMLGRMGSNGSGSQLSSSSKAVGGSSSPYGLPEPSSAFVICCTEKVPCTAWAFSCRVNIEWIKGGRRHSMTVPCDVIRIISNYRAFEVKWAWQFDMAGSLSLNHPS